MGQTVAPILRLENVSRYFGSLAAVKEVSLDVFPGDIYGIAGPNGSGKTTLINTITHIVPPHEGEIYFLGQPIHHLPAFRICRLGIARTFQHPEIFSSLSILDNVTLAAAYGMKPGNEAGREQVWGILEFIGLNRKENLAAGGLISSQKKRLMLGIALATSPQLLILDEPCSGLTTIESKEMISLIEKINQQGLTIVLIEHNMKVLMSISHRVMIMNQGSKICEGSPDQVTRDSQVIRLYLGKNPRTRKT